MTKQNGMLTEADLIKLGNLIDARLEVKLDQKLDQKMANYPTKEEAMADKTEIIKALSDLKMKIVHTNSFTAIWEKTSQKSKNKYVTSLKLLKFRILPNMPLPYNFQTTSTNKHKILRSPCITNSELIL